ncbi:MAG TPA: hypothetical protein VMW57_00985 [Methyloceanibacter sp.]|nr:hypothetical protein [Methyloceanibacter sp.]
MTFNHTVRALLAAGLIAGSLPAAGSAAETSVWTAKVNGDFVTLTYGSLNPDTSPLVMIACFNSMGIAVLNVHADLPDMKLGTPLAIEFTSDGLTAPVEAEAGRDEPGDPIYGEATAIAVKPIVNVLRTDGPVTVKVGAVSAELPIHGRKEAVEQFAKDCSLD